MVLACETQLVIRYPIWLLTQPRVRVGQYKKRYTLCMLFVLLLVKKESFTCKNKMESIDKSETYLDEAWESVAKSMLPTGWGHPETTQCCCP